MTVLIGFLISFVFSMFVLGPVLSLDPEILLTANLFLGTLLAVQQAHVDKVFPWQKGGHESTPPPNKGNGDEKVKK